MKKKWLYGATDTEAVPHCDPSKMHPFPIILETPGPAILLIELLVKIGTKMIFLRTNCLLHTDEILTENN